jgi:hypothetical protein
MQDRVGSRRLGPTTSKSSRPRALPSAELSVLSSTDLGPARGSDHPTRGWNHKVEIVYLGAGRVAGATLRGSPVSARGDEDVVEANQNQTTEDEHGRDRYPPTHRGPDDDQRHPDHSSQHRCHEHKSLESFPLPGCQATQELVSLGVTHLASRLHLFGLP